ncbi:biotin--protein ligase isoform 2-T2 [Xenentodon cancila]
MLITLCYVYMWVRFHRFYSVLIRNGLFRRSGGKSFSFSRCSGSGPGPGPGPSPLPVGGNVFLQLGDKAVYVTEPQVLRWSDYCCPLACSPGQPFRAVAQTTVENFSRLGVAFIEDRLHLDDGLMPSKIVPVLLKDRTLSELLEKQNHQNLKSGPMVSNSNTTDSESSHLQCRKGSLLLPAVQRRAEERRGSEPLPITQHLTPAIHLEEHFSGNHHHMEGHGHHLHLSSCNECLELENSTILSVKYASVENIPDLPDDNSVGVDSVDECLDELDHDAKGFSGQSSELDCKNRLPNVLVYTGGCQERFQAVRQLLLECINVENNIIYPLQPQQALSDPWLDTTRLLVLAEEEALTPDLQTRFLNYLNQGGKVLGLGSSLCPAGLRLEVREGAWMKLQRLNFTREDNTELELSVVASGRVYIRDPQGGGEVELWGELKGDNPHQRDMVIVRVTHGDDDGEAVLCQVQFDISPNSQHVDPESFAALKVSNALRYEVLMEILTSLGLSCEPDQTPAPSPVHLLATSQEAKTSFLKWLQTRADQNAVLTFPKATFRMVSMSKLQDAPSPSDGSLALITDATESQDPTQFDMETYRSNLRTSHLGHTLLHAEVATSTMDLLEGMTQHLPEEVGLIAVVTRQSQGRGRGRNAWLSPPGCAMFTVSVQVELSSRLGQRIPFLQHLAALAIVEAVRTLPGYQDIDLRVKWPNDVYYSNLMKLGGVLVTSTMIGSTFHLLIGCGFNVTNSNPTASINDLIQNHNRLKKVSLQPLSCPQLIARTISCLEKLISSFQQEGPDAVLRLYYHRWLHSGTQVRLWSDDGPEAQVLGLDDNGFLRVLTKDRGEVSVEPDGNSFDMMKNLVVVKHR